MSLKKTCELLKEAQQSGAGLQILSGAGLSVQPGVPVFRMNDGSTSAEFLKFLADYNNACEIEGLETADSWFQFSVPDMFEKKQLSKLGSTGGGGYYGRWLNLLKTTSS